MTNSWKDIIVNSYGWTAMLRINQDRVPTDVSGYSASFVFTSPSGVVKTRSASFATDGYDGVFQYATADGDIDEVGNWSVVAVLTASGLSIQAKKHSFFVESN